MGWGGFTSGPRRGDERKDSCRGAGKQPAGGWLRQLRLEAAKGLEGGERSLRRGVAELPREVGRCRLAWSF